MWALHCFVLKCFSADGAEWFACAACLRVQVEQVWDALVVDVVVFFLRPNSPVGRSGPATNIRYSQTSEIPTSMCSLKQDKKQIPTARADDDNDDGHGAKNQYAHEGRAIKPWTRAWCSNIKLANMINKSQAHTPPTGGTAINRWHVQVAHIKHCQLHRICP